MITDIEIEELNQTMGTIFLDPDQKSQRAQEFEERLTARIVGQERAVRRMRTESRSSAPISPRQART